MTKQIEVNLEARVAELERTVATLSDRLAKLEPKPPPAPPVERQHVMIVHGAPRVRVPDGAMPNDSELTRLRDVVWGKYPILIPRAMSLEQFDVDFKRAFSWLLTVGRRESLNAARDVGFWGTKAARMHGQNDVNLKALCTACVAIGDVAYSTLDDLPHGLAFGLVDVDRDAAADLTAGWRKVLQTGQVLKPIPLYSSSVVAPPRPMVRGAG